MPVITERALPGGHWGSEVMSLAERSFALADDSVQPQRIIVIWILCKNVLVSGAVSSSYRPRPAYFFTQQTIVTPHPNLNLSPQQQTDNCRDGAFGCERSCGSNRFMSFGFN